MQWLLFHCFDEWAATSLFVASLSCADDMPQMTQYLLSIGGQHAASTVGRSCAVCRLCVCAVIELGAAAAVDPLMETHQQDVGRPFDE